MRERIMIFFEVVHVNNVWNVTRVSKMQAIARLKKYCRFSNISTMLLTSNNSSNAITDTYLDAKVIINVENYLSVLH